MTTIDTAALWAAVRLGEDSALELKVAHVAGRRLTAPRPDDIANELAAFANAGGGRLVLGVTNSRTPQALTPQQLDVLMDTVSALCANSIEPPLEYEAHRVPVPSPTEGGVLVVDVAPGHAVHRSPVATTGDAATPSGR